MVDTGSIGIVVSRKFVNPALKLTTEQFELEYSSSGNAYKGCYAWTTVCFSSALDPAARGAVTATTANMRVRVVEQSRAGSDGSWVTDDSNVRMLGVGFARGGLTDTGGFVIPPNINPFLLLDEMVTGSMVRGFIIDTRRKRITLGLTDDNTAGFDFIGLVRQDPKPELAAKADWAAPTVLLAVPSANIAPFEAKLLVDTGLNYAIVQAPLGVAPPLTAAMYLVNFGDTAKCRVQVENGQQFVIAAKNMDVPLYSFTTGTAHISPDRVSWMHSKPPEGQPFVPFVNTSRYALSKCDYLYDDRGRIGFRFGQA